MFSLHQVVHTADIAAKPVTSRCVAFSGMPNAGCSETKENGCGILPVKLLHESRLAHWPGLEVGQFRWGPFRGGSQVRPKSFQAICNGFAEICNDLWMRLTSETRLFTEPMLFISSQ
jgi:hypothetical protein